MEEYCKRVKKNIEIDDDNVSCKYFILRNGKPVCKKALSFPLPTPLSISKMLIQQIIEPAIMFSGLSFGKAIYPSWWCLLFR